MTEDVIEQRLKAVDVEVGLTRTRLDPKRSKNINKELKFYEI